MKNEPTLYNRTSAKTWIRDFDAFRKSFGLATSSKHVLTGRAYGTPNLTKLHSCHDDYYHRNPKAQVDMTIIQIDFPFQDDMTIIQVDFPEY